jgi:hypothetical protein
MFLTGAGTGKEATKTMKKTVNGKLKLVFNKETIASLQDSAMQAIKGGGLRSGDDGPQSCVGKQTICDCLEIKLPLTFRCIYTRSYVNDRCWY